MSEIPETVVECGGCDEDLNLLRPHLSVQIKAERRVLVADANSDPFGATADESLPAVNLGTQSGRGRIVQFHNFKCISKYGKERSDYVVALEPHEEDDIYEPKDNRTPEQLVKAGEMPESMLTYFKAQQRGEA